MELLKLSEKTFMIPGPVNIGLLKTEEGAVLIDTGMHDDFARKVHALLERESLSLKMIINTHSHADHCGGNSLLQSRTNAKIFSSRVESSLISSPELEPFYLYSGASPIKELQKPFLLAKPSDCSAITYGKHTIGGTELEIIALPGHSPEQIGVVSEGILFCADSIFGIETISKYRIPLFVDVKKSLETLQMLEESSYKMYIPSHGSISDIRESCRLNREAIERASEAIRSILADKMSFELMWNILCVDMELKIENPVSYYLMRSAVMAHISYLREEGKIELIVEDNEIFMQAV